MPVRHLLATATTAALAGGLGLAAPAAAHVSVAAGGIGGSGRFGATTFAAVSLAGAIIGGLAVARPTSGGRGRALLALAAGLVGLVLSAVHLALTSDGFGNGQGRAGAIVGVVLGVVGTGLGGWASARARRTT
ncbi:DUF6223 family protein [Micromonospora sediminicola]|uniref:DUF6223 family protein n=1 Tax=Micromonospora sediminicola TaxID=946078 RepID=UPI0037B9E699